MVRLATWNVNSIRARQGRLVALLERHRPELLCLQELKATAADFPGEAIAAAGYQAAVVGQRTYNGVAILSPAPLGEVAEGLGDGVDDPQARLVSARAAGLRLMSAYVPNGGEVGGEKWAYKLGWLDRLLAALRRSASPSEPLVVAGDFNVAPRDVDVAHPEAWRDSVLCHPEVRQRLQALLDWGLVDLGAREAPGGGVYTWWDYRQLAFAKNDGLRIDLVLATEAVARRCRRVWVDRDERKGAKPSDHAPVICELD